MDHFDICPCRSASMVTDTSNMKYPALLGRKPVYIIPEFFSLFPHYMYHWHNTVPSKNQGQSTRKFRDKACSGENRNSHTLPVSVSGASERYGQSCRAASLYLPFFQNGSGNNADLKGMNVLLLHPMRDSYPPQSTSLLQVQAVPSLIYFFTCSSRGGSTISTKLYTEA